MGHKKCCVVHCVNTGRNSKLNFYRFPTAKHKINQRNKWIAAIKRRNEDGSPWMPKPDDLICSAHFVGNSKSDEILSPSYVPTKFLSAYKTQNIQSANEQSAIKRHTRYKKSIIRKKLSTPTEENMDSVDFNSDETSIHDVENMCSEGIANLQLIDKECQVETFINHCRNEKTFTIEKYVCESGRNEIGIQTDINLPSNNIIHCSDKKFADKKCGNEKSFVNKSVGPDKAIEEPACRSFKGFCSIKKKRQLLEFAGVSLPTFNILLKMMKNKGHKASDFDKRDRLLIFLVKLKTGLSYAAIGVMFGAHRVTIQRIFTQLLKHFAACTKDLVFWPRKCDVQATMPESFKGEYSDTRCIIDCTEFKIQIPCKLENRVWCYSNYKRGFTGKLLIAITPSGYICFKSKVAGGRKSDPQITMESGLIDLLEEGDIVLADKGFPEIKSAIDKSGKKVMLVMPPFAKAGTVFTKEEAEETLKIAGVRVHVERIMQRLRVYKILEFVPHNLFPLIDDIVHVCCVLVNFQPPIFSAEGLGED